LLAHLQRLIAEGRTKSIYSNAAYQTFTEVKAVPEFLTHRLQDLERLSHYLRANAIAGQNSYIEFHAFYLSDSALVYSRSRVSQLYIRFAFFGQETVSIWALADYVNLAFEPAYLPFWCREDGFLT
jgi:hypothetical protein